MLNIRPGHLKKTTKPVRSAVNSGGIDALCSLAVRYINTAVVILILGAFFYTYIRLEQDINTVKEEINRIDVNIVSMKRDIETQDMRLAAYSTREYIESRIAHYNLPLVELRQDQQIRVKVYTDAQLANIFRRQGVTPRRVAMDNKRSVNNRRGVRR